MVEATMIRAWNISANHALARGTSASNVRLVWPRDSATGVMISIAVAALTTFTRGGKRGGIGGQVALHALNGQDSRLLRLCAHNVPEQASIVEPPSSAMDAMQTTFASLASSSCTPKRLAGAATKQSHCPSLHMSLRDLPLKKRLIFQPKGPCASRSSRC